MKWDNKHILIIRLSSLGDVLLTTPIVRTLATQHNAKIDFVVKKNFADALKYNPYIERLWIYEDSNEFPSKLKNSNYDIVIDLHNNIRGNRLSRKIDADVIRFKKPSFKKFALVNFKWNMLTPVKSIVERYAESLPEFKLDGEGLDLFLPHDIPVELEENKNYIGICPGAQHFTKRYPLEYHLELIDRLINSGYKPVLFGGKSDRQLCAKIKEHVKDVIDLSTDDDLLRIAANMKKCRTVICNDSGLMHTAAALRLPVIAIFGSTVKEFGFAPYGVESVLIENENLECRPCSHIGKEKCPKKHFDCMLQITPEIVFNKFNKFIENRK